MRSYSFHGPHSSSLLHLVTLCANQAFFEKCKRLAERFETDARRACATGVAVDFLLAARCCGAVAATAWASCFPVVLLKRDGFPAPLLPSLSLPEYGRSGKGKPSGCNAGVRAGVALVTRSFCRLFVPDAVSLSYCGCVRLRRS